MTIDTFTCEAVIENNSVCSSVFGRILDQNSFFLLGFWSEPMYFIVVFLDIGYNEDNMC